MTLKKQSNTSITIGIIIFFVFLLLLVISGRSSGNRSRSGSSVSGKSGSYNKRQFGKRAASMGLTKPEIRTLEYLIKSYNVKEPYNLLKNSKTLNTTLGKAFDRLEIDITPQNTKEGQKLLLYRIKQKIERNSERKQIMTGTKQLNPGQKLHLSTPGGTRYESQVSSNLKDYLGVKIPRDDHGNQIRWKKWTKILVFFWKHNGQGYSFTSKVSGYNNIRGVPSLFLQHSKSIQQAQQRKHRRKALGRPAYFYPIRIITSGTGRNKTRKAIVDTSSGILGTIIEISAGGCSMRASYPLGVGELLKIEFEAMDGEKIIAFAKNKSIKRIKPMGAVMHIMFTKVSQKNINSINSFIYDLADNDKKYN
jgi:hypothetical protein